MADNIAITAGTGTTVATDDIGGVHFERVKLIHGADGTNDGDVATTNPLPIAGPGGIIIAVAPTVTAGAYSAKDAVGGEITFANAVRASAGTAILNTVTIVDKSQAAAGLELWLFHTTITEAADNAAFDISDAELATCVGVVPISTADYYQIADNEVACVRGVGLEFKCAATSLFGQLKCTGTPTYASTSDLTVVLAIEYL